jgi:phage virion morphogenesis protein
MAGSSVSVSIKMDDLKKLERRMTALARVNFTELHTLVGNYLTNDAKARFRRQEGPWDKAWKPSKRAANTKKALTLVRTGRLRNSLTYKAGPDEVAVGTNVVYAAIHQFGGETGRKGARFKMPARPYLGVDEDNRQYIGALVRAHLEKRGLL